MTLDAQRVSTRSAKHKSLDVGQQAAICASRLHYCSQVLDISFSPILFLQHEANDFHDSHFWRSVPTHCKLLNAARSLAVLLLSGIKHSTELWFLLRFDIVSLLRTHVHSYMQVLIL